VASNREPTRGYGVGLLIAFAVAVLSFGIEIKSAPMAMAGPPYQNCGEARADGRSSIPSTDPAYRPELDLDGDGLACEPPKSRRSTR
jgi:Excalibur calcium-binding domain